MNDSAGIAIRGLNKSYRGVPALIDVSFDARPGAITGFLGPNGAGKSTTLRIAAGLARPDSGTVRFNGRLLDELPNPGRHVGFVLDPTALHPGRSVHESLLLNAFTTGVPAGRVESILSLIGLAGVRRRAVKALSLGMRQRLVLGMALLAQPACLVLDEPTNGLDADGAIWVRRFLTHFASSGGTVLVSSHLLRDIQSIAHRIVMIDRGRIVADGATEEFTRTGSCRVQSVDPAALEELLRLQNWRYSIADGVFHVGADADSIGIAAAAAGLPLRHLSDTSESALEARFLELTNGEFAAQQAGASWPAEARK